MGRHEHNFWTWISIYPEDRLMDTYMAYRRRQRPLNKLLELAVDFLILLAAVCVVATFLILLGV